MMSLIPLMHDLIDSKVKGTNQVTMAKHAKRAIVIMVLVWHDWLLAYRLFDVFTLVWRLGLAHGGQHDDDNLW